MTKGKILLTGASGKLGCVITEHLLKKDWEVIAITKSIESSDILTKKNRYNTNLKSINIDLISDNFENSLINKLGKINNIYGIIHNARNIKYLDVSKDGLTSSDNFINEFKMAVNIPYEITNFFKNKNLKRVIFINSQYGVLTPKPELYENGLEFSPIQYGVSKAAQLQLARELATRLSKNGILVNSIILGGIAGRNTSQFAERYSKFLPLGRMLYDIEILPAIDFLLDPKNSACCGSSVTVDGGWTI